MLDALWAFLKDPADRETLGWIGAGIVVVVSAVWAVIKFCARKNDADSKSSVQASNGGVAASTHSVAAGRDIVGSVIRIGLTAEEIVTVLEARGLIQTPERGELPSDWEPVQQHELSGDEQRREAAAVTLGYQTSRRNLQRQIFEAYTAACKEKGYDPANPPERAVVGRNSKGEISIIWKPKDKQA
jgi:hypothetical protein